MTNMEQTEIRIGGMSCQGCVKNIAGVLGAMAGVTAANVSLEQAIAAISFDPQQVTREALLSAIEDAGFDAE